jgi:hypothetical protein
MEGSAGRADGGECDRLLDRPREGDRDPMSCRGVGIQQYKRYKVETKTGFAKQEKVIALIALLS